MKKNLYLSAIVLFFCVQFYHTYLNVSHWPFSPMNLFHSIPDTKRKIYYFHLEDELGKQYQVHFKEVVPIEQFRVKTVLDFVFKKQNDPYKKEQYLKNLITILNEHPVKFSMLEIYPSFQAEGHSQFKTIELYQYVYDVDTFSAKEDFTPINKIPIYSYSGGTNHA